MYVGFILGVSWGIFCDFEVILGSSLATFSHLFAVSFSASILGSFLIDFGTIFVHFLETELVWGSELMELMELIWTY